MVGFGVILLIGGSISLIYGILQNNSGSAQLNSLLTNGSANPGTVFIVIGAIAVVAGLLMIILGSLSKTVGNTGSVSAPIPPQTPNQKEDQVYWVCPNCSRINPSKHNVCVCGTPKLIDEEVTDTTDAKWICPQCGNELDDHMEFCFKCGTKKPDPTVCASCGRKLDETDNFCPNCGWKRV